MASLVIDNPHNDSISAMESAGIRSTAPSIEMVPNPAFSFPMRAPDTSRRPTSMLLSPSPGLGNPHKRTASALPSFTFNATDNSGRVDTTPPRTPDESSMGQLGTPGRKGHKRGGSEFVGGDSRFGFNNAITSSPTKTEAPLLPSGPPAGRRAHAHRRSVAVSSHDLSQIMSAGDKSPKLSGSLPSTPDIPPVPTAPMLSSVGAGDLNDQRQPQPDDSPARPPSRPRVEFVEQVEIIPRPLSTISSETESSVSTVMGHSVSNSINSVLSLRSPSHSRVPSTGYSVLGPIAEPQGAPADGSKRVEKEGEWLKTRPVSQDSQHLLTQTISAPAAPRLVLEEPTVPKRQKRQSLGHAFGFERRRSEPLITMMTARQSRLSALSLQDVISRGEAETPMPEKRTSGQKLKQWALSKLQRRHRDTRPQTAPGVGSSNDRPEGAGSVDVPSPASSSHIVAETDLDAVFGSVSVESSPLRYGKSPTQMTFEQPSPQLEGRQRDIDDDLRPMLDLDAALGSSSSKSPMIGTHRRHMHSDRASSASNFLHRRAESEPVLMAFNYNRTGTTPQKSMEDVFEEDEDDTTTTAHGEEAGMGITMVDADRSAFDPASLDRQRARRVAQREPDRPYTSYISPTASSLSIPLSSGRPASLVDDIIAEESSPVEIVEAHEEPRAASLEKASDSSEASTLLAAPLLALADEHGDALSPETFNSSSFSSPDFSRRQGSFEASRVGTSASSLADTRTTSSCATGDAGHEIRMSVDDVPSLTSSRSTMMSTLHAETGRRSVSESRIYEAIPRQLDPEQVAARRKKRASIQSLSQLVGGTFGSKTRLHDDSRPQTANLLDTDSAVGIKIRKKEHRLKKLMFWRSKQNLRQAAREDGAQI